jgi:hypothetical protein
MSKKSGIFVFLHWSGSYYWLYVFPTQFQVDTANKMNLTNRRIGHLKCLSRLNRHLSGGRVLLLRITRNRVPPDVGWWLLKHVSRRSGLCPRNNSLESSEIISMRRSSAKALSAFVWGCHYSTSVGLNHWLVYRLPFSSSCIIIRAWSCDSKTQWKWPNTNQFPLLVLGFSELRASLHNESSPKSFFSHIFPLP